MNLKSLNRRAMHLEKQYVPPVEYGRMFIPSDLLSQLSESDYHLVIACSNRGVTDAGATMQVADLSNEQIAALRPVARQLDRIRQQKEGILS